MPFRIVGDYRSVVLFFLYFVNLLKRWALRAALGEKTCEAPGGFNRLVLGLVGAEICVAGSVALEPFINHYRHKAGAIAHFALGPGDPQAAHELKRGVVNANAQGAAFAFTTPPFSS